jgi:hypothetical protein
VPPSSSVQNDDEPALTMRSGSRPTVTSLLQRQAEPPLRECVNVFSFSSTEISSSPTPAAP